MPHDRNGAELKVGDQVLISAMVKEIYTSDDYCNAQFETAEVMHPGDQRSVVTLNTKQVVKYVPASSPLNLT